MTRKFILSPVGTSVLTNTARDIKANGKTVIDNSNAKNKSDITSEEIKILCEIIVAAEKSLSNANVEQAAKLSAEINGITKIYNDDLRGKSDHHCLLRTDTWLGEKSATLVKNWLEAKGLNVEIKHQTDLQTKEFTSFQLALSELVKWCDEVVRGYKDSGYKIVFNLTGGFKSVQGFLQTLAMFYADETVYVFEASESLMRIPRLPIEMSVEKEVRENITEYRRLSLGLPVRLSDTTNLAETMLMQIGDECCLSPWGEIVWQQVKKKIYAEKLWAAPSTKIRYGEKFEDSLKGIEAKRLIAVNAKIDDLAREIETGQRLSSLDFKELKGNPCPPSTHEIDAWHDQDARRIFGHYKVADENRIFVLDKLDKALH